MIIYHFRTIKDEHLQTFPEPRPGVWIDVVEPTGEELDQLVSNFGLDLGILKDATDFFEVPRFERSGAAVYFFTRYLLDSDVEHIDTAPILLVVGESFVLTLTIASAPFLVPFREGTKHVITTQKTKLFLELMTAIAEEYARELTQIRRGVNRMRGQLRKIRNKNIERLVEYENALNDIVDSLVPTSAWLSQVLTGNYLQLFKEDIALVEDLTIANNQLVGSGTSLLKAIQNIRAAHESILTSNLNVTIRMFAALTILLTIPMIITSFFGMNVPVPLQQNKFGFVYILLITCGAMGALWYYFSKKRWL